MVSQKSVHKDESKSVNKDVGDSERRQARGTDFAEAYVRQGKPRIALFMNRGLSDTINTWSASSRAIKTRTGNVTIEAGCASMQDKPQARSMGKNDMGRYSQPVLVQDLHEASLDSRKGRNVSRYDRMKVIVEDDSLVLFTQEKNDVGEEREAFAETVMWDVENGFLSPFLKAGANMVDRSSIMRLFANSKDPSFELDAKRIEISSLQKFADIFVELMMTETNDDYVLKAVAKQVATGRILALADSRNVDFSSSKDSKEYVATSQGYEVVDPEDEVTIRDVSFELARALMQSLSHTWASGG
jgi:hypothetical protein